MAEEHTDLFRFFVHRGVQQSTAQATRRWIVPAYPDGLPTADRQLIQGRGYYTYRRSAEYRGTLASPLLTGLDAALREVVPHETAQQLSRRISRAIRKQNPRPVRGVDGLRGLVGPGGARAARLDV